MKSRYLELVVGLVFVTALVLLGVFTIVIGDFGFLYEKHALVVTFERVEQLDTGDLVTYRGKMSGKVNRITLTPKGVEVELSLREALALYQDYEIAIEQGSLLGRKIVTINPGHPPEPARPPFRGVVKALIPGLGDIGSKLNEAIDNINQLASDARTGKGTIADLLNNPETRDSIRTAAKNLGEITTDIREGKGTLAQLLTKDEIYEDIKAAAASVRLATSAESKGTLARLLHDEKLYENVNNLVLGVKDFLEDMKQSLPASTILFLLPAALQ